MKSIRLLGIFFFSCASIYAQNTGCILGNCDNGWGSYRWETGDKYTGEWVNGNRTGLGVYDWSSGTFYYGYFKDGKLNGDGFFIGLDSTQDQVGLFRDGSLVEKKSYGTTGCILGDCYNGAGVYLWETNDLYIGQYQSGNRTGYGRYDWEDGSWYIGYFTNGALNGQGEYHPETGDNMIGTFLNGEFQGTTSGNNSPSPVEPPAYSNTTTTESDLCTVIQKVIKDYPENFKNIKGQKEPADEFDFGDQWYSSVKVSNSTEAKISEPLLSNHNTWYNVMLEGGSYNAARKQYDDYVASMKSCNSYCCTGSDSRTGSLGRISSLSASTPAMPL